MSRVVALRGLTLPAHTGIDSGRLLIMLTEEEKKFIEYWKENRLRKKKIFRNLSVGLPLGVLLVSAIFINFFSGWYKRADMMLRADVSIVPVLLVAILFIVVFVTIFSARHRWDMNEQKFNELISRNDHP